MKRSIVFALLVLSVNAEAVRVHQNKHASEQRISPIPYVQVWTQGKLKFVYIEKEHSTNKNGIHKLSQLLCKNENVCSVMYWDNSKLTPRSMPMTDEQLSAKVAHYNYNKNSGLNRVTMCNVSGC